MLPIPATLGEMVFCAIDLETTGINPFTDKIIEIGAVKFTVKGTVGEYETLVDPGIEISRESFYIHGITDLMVRGKPTVDGIAEELLAFVGNSILIIQNTLFDLSFLEMEYLRCGRKFRFSSAFDTVGLARRYFPGLPNYKLGTLSRHLGIMHSHHRALSDSVACMGVFTSALKVAGARPDWSFADLEKFAGAALKGNIINELNSKKVTGAVIVPGSEFIIDYTDTNGQETRRKIRTRAIFRRGQHTIIHAYCHLRHEDRFFLSSRIRTATPIASSGGQLF